MYIYILPSRLSYYIFLQIKCHQYWPDNGQATYGDLRVTLSNQEKTATYCIRKFSLQRVAKTISI